MIRLCFILSTVIIFSCKNEKMVKEGPMASSQAINQISAEKGEDSLQLLKNEKSIAELSELKIYPQNIGGDLGRMTFTDNDSTMFYFDNKTKKGKIIMNQIEYIVDSISVERLTGLSNEDGIFPERFILFGNDLQISCSPCEYKTNMGGDCFYCDIATFNVSFQNKVVILENLKVQNCP